jgi:hypothetical protein
VQCVVSGVIFLVVGVYSSWKFFFLKNARRTLLPQIRVHA